MHQPYMKQLSSGKIKGEFIRNTLFRNRQSLSIFPLTYLQGRQPLKKKDIALSVLSSDSLQKKVGEKITLVSNGHEIEKDCDWHLSGCHERWENSKSNITAISAISPLENHSNQLNPGVEIEEKK
ncbi:hypothetical protein ACEQPO_29650 [Bacillus sp. SL00103]